MPMSPDEIKKKLGKRGLTQVMIARVVKPKVSPTQMHRVVYGRDRSPRLREAIARALNLPIEQVFPPTSDKKHHAA